MSKAGPKPGRGRPRTIEAAKVLDAAMAAYWHTDPADVSVNAICHAASVSKPSLYREFGSEDGLMRATLDLYADRVLSDVFAILQNGSDLRNTLNALIDFAVSDPRMEAGCLFTKMRAGKHRLGPNTSARVEEIAALAHTAYRMFLQSCRDTGELPNALSIELASQYLGEQIALAITQRASGENPVKVQKMLQMALSIFW